MTDLVSIIIINYNTFGLTSNCIKSVIAHTHGVNYEILVVDNASTERNAEDLLISFPSVRLIRNDVNLGFAKANNVGIAHARGNYVLLLNSDTYLTHDAVSTLFSEMSPRKEVAIASGRLIFENGRIQGVCQRFPSIWLFLLEFTRFQKLLPKERKGRILLGSFFNYNTEVYPDWVWGTFVLIRKELIQKLPGQKLNDDFFMYCEDIQWCLDFRKLGYRTFYTPKAEVVHLMGGSSANKSPMISKNFNILLKKNYNFIHAAVLKLIYQYYYH